MSSVAREQENSDGQAIDITARVFLSANYAVGFCVIGNTLCCLWIDSRDKCKPCEPESLAAASLQVSPSTTTGKLEDAELFHISAEKDSDE